METIAQMLKHDFELGRLCLYDSNGNLIYSESSDGYWEKYEYDDNNNLIYSESSNGDWSKQEYDDNNNEIYYENSNDKIIDNRPTKEEIIEIDGKKYKLTPLG
jgi:hypothetical protein